jgi:hypothetical protein
VKIGVIHDPAQIAFEVSVVHASNRTRVQKRRQSTSTGRLPEENRCDARRASSSSSALNNLRHALS